VRKWAAFSFSILFLFSLLLAIPNLSLFCVHPVLDTDPNKTTPTIKYTTLNKQGHHTQQNYGGTEQREQPQLFYFIL